MNLSLCLLGTQEDQKYKSEKLYTRCPACGSKDLIWVQPETLCGTCDWESTVRSVQSGKMDQIFKAYKEQFKGDICLL